MRLASVRLHGVGPFEDTTLRFAEDGPDVPATDEEGEPSPPVPVRRSHAHVVFAGDGAGKTSLLAAIASTRPGAALPPLSSGAFSANRTNSDAPSFAVTEWWLGDDDPERPHPLVVASPSAVLDGEAADQTLARRREQSLFDRRAQNDGGFAFVAFSGARWFSRTPNMLTTPERTLLRYDVRQAFSFDDPARADLTRETKQMLSYAEIARRLGAGRAEFDHLVLLDAAIREVANVMLEPFGFEYAGTHPLTLEPEARDRTGHVAAFDALPRSARHMLAIGVLTLRSLYTAYLPLGLGGSPRDHEGVALVDDIEEKQDPTILKSIVPLLNRALPNVHWIMTTSRATLALACDPRDVITLRRDDTAGIEVGEGVLH